MNYLLTLFLVLTLLVSCAGQTSNKNSENSITCDSLGCRGTYYGPEFINNDDVAHQFSNKMSAEVGDQLKTLYKKGNYSVVDFDNIQMTTNGMGSGKVNYTLIIPFKRVNEKCDAFTSFDHCGGWNHQPALKGRKKQLSKALLLGEKLIVSELKTTPEGLQEYWIQWKNKAVQAECAR